MSKGLTAVRHKGVGVWFACMNEGRATWVLERSSATWVPEATAKRHLKKLQDLGYTGVELVAITD